MGWEAKGRSGKRYYYRCLRISGRPTKRYVGHGPDAESAAGQDEQARVARLVQREAVRVEQVRRALADTALRDLRTVLQALVEVTLVALGYYRHHRGEWRHRRGSKS